MNDRSRPITFGGRFCDYDYIEEDSDQEGGRDSSDDEIDMILHGTPEQKRKLTRSLSHGSLDLSSSSDDEFEKEMEQELEESLRQHQLHNFSQDVPQNSASSSKPSSSEGKPKSDYYDEIYFDSDDEEDKQKPKDEATSAKKQKTKHRILTNEELFYDPAIDDDNQKWVDTQRSIYHSKKNKQLDRSLQTSSSEIPAKPNGQKSKIPQSDAILNCPACMTTLCLDCQRHEIYPTQYRAMFVLNCEIVRSERLKYSAAKENKKKWKKNKRRKNQKNDGNLEEIGTRNVADSAEMSVQGGADGSNKPIVSEKLSGGSVGPGRSVGPGGNVGPGGSVGSAEQLTHNIPIDEAMITIEPNDGAVGSSEPALAVPSVGDEFYHPVKCSICKTEVAVYDKDEVFHFFNVITSIS